MKGKRVRLVNWNIHRQKPGSVKAESLVSEIRTLGPDLICLTEAWETSLDSLGGHTLSVPGIAWSKKAPGERKVLLWAPRPWICGGPVEELEAIGSGVSGWTEIGGARVRIVGLCIPYRAANPYLHRPKLESWVQHGRFVAAVAPLLKRWRREGPVIVVGDYNRKMPRVGTAGVAEYTALEDAFGEYDVATRGKLPGMGLQTVDHVAFAGNFRVTQIEGRSSVTPEGLVRSDHFGVVVDFELRG